MPRVLLTLFLLLLLVTSRVGAQDADIVFHLALPTRPDGAQAIETLKAVVVAMGAHLMSRAPWAFRHQPPGVCGS